MKLSIQAGATSQSINVFISDSSSTTGAGLTGLVYNSGSLTAYYSFTGANATATAITLATLSTVTSAYSSGGFKEIDATNMPGWYRLDLPNAVLATSKGRVVSLLLKGATNMAPCPVEIELTGWDNQDTVRGGLTALPNVASGSAGAIPTVGTGTAQINVSGGRADANVTYFNGSAGTFSSGRPEVNASYVGGSAVASGVLPNAAAGATGGLILIGTGTRDINPNAGGVVITSTGMDDVAAHVWDLAFASHNTSGTFGYQVQNIATGSPPTAAAIADAVWDEAQSGHTTSGTFGKYLDTEVSGRMATFTLPTNFSSLAIDGSGRITVGTNADKTGYSLTQAFPTNFSSLAITGGGAVTVGTNNDKTGYALTQTFPTNFADLAITSSTGRVTVGTNNDKTGYTCSTVGSGAITTSSFAAGAIDAAAIATDAIGSLELAAGAASEIATAVASAVSTSQTRCRVDMGVTSSAGSEVRILAWLEQNGTRVALPSGSCTVTFREHGSGSDLFSVTDSAPNAAGVFELTKTTPGFTNDRVYLVTVAITDNTATTYTTFEAFPVFG